MNTMNLDTILIHEEKTIVEALRKLNEIRDVSRLILFVHDDDGVVVGSLTDGDIRRSLATEMNIEKKIEGVCNRNYIFEYDGKDFLDLNIFREKKIKILPILNKNRQLIRIIDLDKTKAILPLECVIMAGGRGKRLSPLTDKTPKPMLMLGDKPIIEHNIDRLVSYGIKKIYITLKYLGEQIQEYFGDGSQKGIEIDYVWEDQPLGTAGALSLVEEYGKDHILLMNSDLFTNIDFEDLYLSFLRQKADMIVASTEYKVDIPYAVFETNSSVVTGFKEKPTYVYHSNAGIYILKKNLIKHIPPNQFYDITELMERVVTDGGKLVYNPILGFWIDIGKPIDYKQAQEFVKHFNP